MTAILGLSGFYHDSAAVLVIDGKIVAAAQEERFTRIKHDASFPRHAVEFCLQQGGISRSEIDHVGFYEKPLLKFERLLESYLTYAPKGIRSFMSAMPGWISQKLHLRREIRRQLDGVFRRRIVFCSHHQSHAASAFYPSPFDKAAILTVDGVGEWATSTMGVGNGNRIQIQRELRFPHSLGLLYSAFTYYCGFRVNSGEYKLMGLAPYGQPKYVDLIMDSIIHLHDDGSFRLNMEHFGYCDGLRMIRPSFHRLFGRPPREPESEITELDKDVAASIQQVTEEVMLRSANHLHATTGRKQLCLAGGVALNCVANGRILRESPFEQVWIQPAAGDAGGALGVAMLIWHQLLGNERSTAQSDEQQGSLLGPCYCPDRIRETLDQLGASYQWIPEESNRNEKVAELLAQGNIVGRFAGRAEFGPRALGNRSILADPRPGQMQSKINMKIKFRESFRPFAPAVLKDHVWDHFDMPDGTESPYMLLVCQAKSDWLSAVTHVDGSARVQTVDGDRNPEFSRLLHAFHHKTGCPALVNTSFNVRGEPIVGSPEDAYRCFLKTGMDALVIGNCLLQKSLHNADSEIEDRTVRDE